MTINNNASTQQLQPLLNSWKEIACYLGRGVRTVQRWEREQHLPVHRIGSGTRAPVYAVTSELKFWIENLHGPTVLHVVSGQQTPHNAREERERDAHLHERFHKLVQLLAVASEHHLREVEALKKNILVLRSTFSSLKSRRQGPSGTAAASGF